MRQDQWETLQAVVSGERVDPLPVGFIIDSPWLPNWAGFSIMDYFTSDRVWMAANRAAAVSLPEIMFLPGFWSEYGMCTEPSAFGARPVWHENEFPFAEEIIAGAGEIPSIEKPDPAKHGLCPLALKRLVLARDEIENDGHAVRFATARGPLNIAGFLMGQTGLLMGMKTEPDRVHALLGTVTDFIVDWLRLQAEAIDTIDGIFLLDDIVGFVGDEDFTAFAKPYLQKAFAAFDASVGFFHNDARGAVCAPHLAEIGVNLFNFAFEHSLAEMRELAGREVTLLGNIPPRDVLASGTPGDVRAAVREALDGIEGTDHLVLSCGGGMPPGVATENIEAFVAAARA